MIASLAALVMVANFTATTEPLVDPLRASPEMVARLQRRVVGDRWTRISTPTSRFDVRVGRLDELGLGDLTPRNPLDRPRDPMGWSEISRIDQLRTRRTRGAILGAGAGVLALVTVTGPSGAFQSNATNAVLIMSAGALGGGWFGRRVGARFEREFTVYAPERSRSPAVAPVSGTQSAPTVAVAPVPGTQSAPTVVLPADEGVAATLPEPTSPRLKRASRHVGPGRLLRLTRSDHSQETGYAVSAGIAGLHGFRPNETFRSDHPPQDVIPWSGIERIHLRGNYAGPTALRAGLATGGVCGLLGMAIAGIFDGRDSAVAAGAGLGFAIGGGIGVTLGGTFGSLTPRWMIVY